jgi:hypothetical protein
MISESSVGGFPPPFEAEYGTHWEGKLKEIAACVGLAVNDAMRTQEVLRL